MESAKPKSSFLRVIGITLLLFAVGFVTGNVEGVLPKAGEVICNGPDCLDILSFGGHLALPAVVTVIVALLTNVGMLDSSGEKKLANVVVSLLGGLAIFGLKDMEVDISGANIGLILQIVYNALGAAATYEFSRGKPWPKFVAWLKGLFGGE